MGEELTLYSLFLPQFAIMIALTTAYFSDRTSRRAPFIVFHALLVIVGLSMTRWLEASNTAGRYAGIFLAAAGCNANVAACLGQAGVSITGQSKRGYTSALQGELIVDSLVSHLVLLF